MAAAVWFAATGHTVGQPALDVIVEKACGADSKQKQSHALSQLTDAYAARSDNRDDVRLFVNSLFGAISGTPEAVLETKRTCLKVISLFLADLDTWFAGNPDDNGSRTAVEKLGAVVLYLRSRSGTAGQQVGDPELLDILEDAISKAEGMYLDLVREYLDKADDLENVIEAKLIPLLELRYVQQGRYEFYIRAMIANKYADLALIDADTAKPICAKDENNIRVEALVAADRYKKRLLDGIESGEVPAEIHKLRNDLLYEAALGEALACSTEAALGQLKAIVDRSGTIDTETELSDQIYVFRHLRTKRSTHLEKKRFAAGVEGEVLVFDRSDIVRRFFNAAQYASYTCRVILRGGESLSVDQLRLELLKFQNVDFRIVLRQSSVVGANDPAWPETWKREFETKLGELIKQVSSQVLQDNPSFAEGPVAVLLADDLYDDKCGAFDNQAASLRGTSAGSLFQINAVTTPSDAAAPGSLEGWIGGRLSYEDAKALSIVLAEHLDNLSVRVLRPTIQD